MSQLEVVIDKMVSIIFEYWFFDFTIFLKITSSIQCFHFKRLITDHRIDKVKRSQIKKFTNIEDQKFRAHENNANSLDINSKIAYRHR